MICDIITYNGERELFELRYNILKDYVDRFIVVQFDKTFSGKEKTQFEQPKFSNVYTHINTEKTYGKYLELARSSPNTEYGMGADHWIREFCQKESIKDTLTDLKDDDIVFIGDVDEIWDPTKLREMLTYSCKLKLKVYSYYLNNRSNEQFWGTIVAQYQDIKNKTLNHLRSFELPKTDNEFGWHFTSMGGYDRIKEKLEDSYTEDTYANPSIMQNLEQNVLDNKDFLGRNFKYKIDESEWPEYLKDNKEKYKHLLRSE